MSACSRCGSLWPNSACFVCAVPDPPERDWFEIHDEHEALMDAMEARGEAEEEERKLEMTR